MITVVVVEDEVVVAEVLAAVLSDEGYDVITASHGQDALDRLAEHPHAKLVLSDFRMPVMNGAGLLSAMRVCPIHGCTPFIMMSSMPEHEVRRQSKSYEAFLRKPFALGDVLALVAHVLGIPPPAIH